MRHKPPFAAVQNPALLLAIPATRRMCEMRQQPIAVNGILSAILPEIARPYRIPALRICRARANTISMDQR